MEGEKRMSCKCASRTDEYQGPDAERNEETEIDF